MSLLEELSHIDTALLDHFLYALTTEELYILANDFIFAHIPIKLNLMVITPHGF